MAVKSEIMDKTARDGAYDATDEQETLDLAEIVKKDLTGNKWTIDGSKAGKIKITYKDSKIDKDAIEEGVPAKEGEINYVIKLQQQDATLKERGLWEYKADASGKYTMITDGEIDIPIGAVINNYDPTDVDESVPASALTYATKSGTVVTGTVNASNSASPGTGSSDTPVSLSNTTSLGSWKVLGVDDATGEILLVSANVGPTVKLQGYVGYQYGINELNNLCAVYGHGQYATGARSITADDVNRITGFNPKNVGVYDSDQTGTGTVYPAGGPFSYAYGTTLEYSWAATAGKISTTVNGADAQEYSIPTQFDWLEKGKWNTSVQNTSNPTLTPITTLTQTAYIYNVPSLLAPWGSSGTAGWASGTDIYNLIVPSSGSYWLASRAVDVRTGFAYFDLGVVYSYNQVDIYCYLYSSSGGGVAYSNGVRPIVSLQSNVKIKDGATAGTYDIEGLR